MTPREILEKIITFSKHLKSENNEIVISDIVPHGDSYKEIAEAVNKLLKIHVPKRICILFVTVTLMLNGT